MVALQISRTLPAQITPLMMSEANISHQHRVSFYNPRFTYLAQPKHRRRLKWSRCLARAPNCMQNVTYPASAHRYAVEGQTSRRRGGCSCHIPKGRTFVRSKPTFVRRIRSTTDLQTRVDDSTLIARKHRARSGSIFQAAPSRAAILSYTRRTYERLSL